MKKLWQLKRLSDGVALNEPQLLPESWGVMFGMSQHLDRLADVSWMGPEYADMGWFEVGELPVVPEATPADLLWQEAKDRLRDCDWTMMPDVPMTNDIRRAWEEYRRFLREIRMHPEFPNVTFPTPPE